jgi:hypothetical protein
VNGYSGEDWCVIVVPAGAPAAFLADCRSDRPAKALSVAAVARGGGRKARGLLPAQDAALGPLGTFLGMPPIVSSPLSRPWVASTGLKTW